MHLRRKLIAGIANREQQTWKLVNYFENMYNTWTKRAILLTNGWFSHFKRGICIGLARKSSGKLSRSKSQRTRKHCQLVEAFRMKRMTSAKKAEDSLQDILLREIKSRANVSTKFRTARGTFAKKDVEDLSWKNYVRHFFGQHPGFKTTCSGCEKSYDKAESFLTHLRRSQIARETPPPGQKDIPGNLPAMYQKNLLRPS